jgi:rsbT antagonist protein RsbS
MNGAHGRAPGVDAGGDVARVPMHVSRGCLLVSLQMDLDSAILNQLREDLLGRIRAAHLDQVLLDVSGLDVLDLRDFEELRLTMSMAELMGARTVLVGMRPGIVSSLIDLGVDVDGMTAAVDMDDAFRLLEQGRRDRAR